MAEIFGAKIYKIVEYILSPSEKSAFDFVRRMKNHTFV
jgi:hypothetical protein